PGAGGGRKGGGGKRVRAGAAGRLAAVPPSAGPMSLCGDSGPAAVPRLRPRAAQMARRPELLCGAAILLGCAFLVALKVTCR
uniref:Uncharacterized protein n=1 Tax=Strigops habroptila TaxID=2489341 RepID=A0A672TWN1_STRHB